MQHFVETVMNAYLRFKTHDGYESHPKTPFPNSPLAFPVVLQVLVCQGTEMLDLDDRVMSINKKSCYAIWRSDFNTVHPPKA